MSNLFGTNPNQVPLNSMLGNLAFQDKAYVSVDKVGIGTTAVDTGTSDQVLQAYGGAYVSGNTGIGTTNPTQSLHVQGSARLTGALYDGSNVTGSSGQILSSTGSAISWINANTTNVGSANSIGINLDPNTNASRYLTFVSTTSGNNLVYVDSELLYNPSTNTLGINTTSFTGTASQTLQVTGGAYVSGNLGIGTTNPSDKLHTLGGNIRIDSATGALNFWSGAGYYGGIGVAGGLGGSGTDIVIRSDAGRSIIFFTGGANDRGRIDSNGIFLVGSATSTGTASQRLQVTGGAYVSGVGVGTGSIGVGITNPQGAIDIRTSPQWNSFNWGANLVIGGSRNNALVILDSVNTNPWGISNGAGNLNFGYGPGLGDTTNPATTILTLHKSSSSVLIGSATPTGTASQLLQVSGGAYVSGNLGIGTTNPISPLEVAQDTTGVHDLTVTNLNTGNNITKASRIRFRLTDSIGNKKDVAYITAYTYNLDSSVGNYLSFFTRTLDSTPTEKMRLDNNGNLVLGSSFTPTGTASQPLQVSGGAYVSGNLGIGTTNPANKIYAVGSNDVIRIDSSTTSCGILMIDSVLGSRVGSRSGNIIFDTNSLERVRIDTSGNAGINTTNPLQKLHVLGNLLVAAGSSTGQHITQKAYELNSGTLSWEGSAGQLFSITNNLTSGSIFSVNDVSGIPSIDVDANGTIELAPFGGNIGVGTTSPSQKLDIVGNVRFRNALYDINNSVGAAGNVLISTGVGVSWTNFSGGATVQNDTTTNATWYPTLSSATSGAYSTAYVSNTKLQFNPSTGTLSATVFTSLSDETQKTNIRPIENALDLVKQLNGVKYDWKDGHNQSFIGVIAQEVERVLPEVVTTNDQGLKTVSYGNIVGVLIEAIKEQQKCIEELERKLGA